MLKTSGSQQHNIIIVGDGLIGAALVRALNHPSLCIVWVKASKKNVSASPEDKRVIALAEGSRRILDELGVWANLSKDAHPIKQVNVSDQGQFPSVRIKAKDYRLGSLGNIVPAYLLQSALNNSIAQTSSKIKEVYCTEVKCVQRHSGKIEITVCSEEGEQSILAELLIAADGAQSKIRNLEAIMIDKRSNQQTAIITEIEIDRLHNNVAHERFTAIGTIGLLPLTAKRYAVVWAVKNQYLSELLALNKQQFIKHLNKYVGHNFVIKDVNDRNVVPLKVIYAYEQIRPRFVLIGNAAHNLHPVAGQGFNLGLRDIDQLAKVIITAIVENKDIGAWQLLQDYYDARRVDQYLIEHFSDFIVSIFSYNFLPITACRNFGLLMIDKLPFLKRMLALKTMGLK